MGLLADAKLDQLYERDIWGLNALLDQLGQRGIPIDEAHRERVARELEAERTAVLAEMQRLVPESCKPKKIYKRLPQAIPTEQLCCEVVEVIVLVCPACGHKRPTKKHPCRREGVQPELKDDYMKVWVKRLDFKPSTKQLVGYLKAKGYPVPKKRDLVGEYKDTTEESALRRLALKHELDALFPLVLKYRELDKWLGTYVGRIV